MCTIFRENCAAVISVAFAIMTGRHPWCSEVGSVSKRQRKAITIEVKMDVLERSERGVRTADMRRALGLSASTFRTIRNSAEKIKEGAKCGTSVSATKTSHGRSSMIEKMERPGGVRGRK